VDMMMRAEISLSGRDTERSTNSGMSSMLTNGREIQRRVNSTKTLVCMLKDHSTLSPNLEDTDTSTLLEETSSLRLEMEEHLNNGGSINNL
jgi:hypothetical protein